MASGVDIATAWINVVPSFRGMGSAISKELGGIDQRMSSSSKSWGSGVASALGGAFKASAGIAVAAFTTASGVISANLGGAIQRADLLNSFPKTMANIGFSAEEAAAQIKRISDSLDGLPTSSDALVSVAKGLAPLTGNLTSATDVALALNDALLAGGASGDLAANAMEQYRQMLANGKPDMMAWRSMTMAMPGQMDQIAKSILGASANTSTLYDALQSGAISFSDFNEALVALDEKGIGGLASFKDQAITASAGIGTAIANASNRIKKAIATIIGAVGVDRISSAINQATSGIVGFGEAVAAVISSMSAGGGFSVLSGALSGLAPVVGGLLGMLGPLTQGIPILGGVFGSLTGPIGLVMGAMVGLLQNSEALRGALGEAFAQIGASLSSLASIGRILLSLVGEILGELGDALAPVISALIPVISQIVDLVGSQLAAVMPSLVSAVGSVVGVIGQVIAALGPLIAQVAGVLMPVIAELLPIFTTAFQGIASVVSAAMAVVSGVISTATALISGDWSGAWSAMQATVKAAWTLIQTYVQAGASYVRAVVSGWSAAIKSFFASTWGSALSSVSSSMSSMGRAVAGGVISVMAHLRALPGQVAGVFANAGSWLVSAGRSIIDGLIAGIRSAFGRVRSTLSNLTAMLPDWKGPEDLDKVILRDAGGLVIGGFVEGMESQYNEARRSLGKFTNTLAPSVSGSINAAPAGAVGAGESLAGRRLYLVVDGREFEAYVEDVQGRALAPASRSRARELMGI